MNLKPFDVATCGNTCPPVATPRKLFILHATNICKQGVGGSSPLTSTNLTNHIENDEFGHDTQALALLDSRHGKRMAIPAGQDAIPHASFYFWSLRPRFIFSGSGECPWCAKKKG